MQPAKPPASHRHVLVCTNVRDPTTGKPSCGLNGGTELREHLKRRVKEGGLKGRLKVTAVGCLDFCPNSGVAIGCYPENAFFITDGSDVEGVWKLLTEGPPL